MISKLIQRLNERLWIKVLVPVSIIVMGVVSASLWYNISFQTQFGKEQLQNQNGMVAKAIEGGMFDALAIGDNDTVRSQFKRLNEKVKDIKVFVYDFNGLISFSTDIQAVGKEMNTLLSDDSKTDIMAMLETGKSSERSFHQSIEGMPFLFENTPILNEPRCFHCHGESRKVLGGISVFSSESTVKQTIAHGKNISIFIGGIGLMVLILFIWIFFHFMVNIKVHKVLEATSNLRQKDFTHAYEVTKGDEIDHILSRINVVTQDLRKTITQVVKNSGTIFNSASELNTISENLTSASAQASEKAVTVSSAAEEMSIQNQSLAVSMDQSTLAFNAIAAAIEEMSGTIGEIARNAKDSKEITQEVVEGFDTIIQAVNELGERANDVDLVTDKIRSISEQVSMLALNAKIEAARAGDAGKGFAVVAQEITELARKTNESTLQADITLRWIKEKSKEVTQKVSGLATIVDKTDQAISRISTTVEEQNLTTQEIARNITDISSQLSEANTNVTEGASVAAQIAKEITQVEEGFRQVQKSSNQLSKNAVSLSAMAENFKELMNQFKV